MLRRMTGSPGSVCAAPITSAAHSATISKALGAGGEFGGIGSATHIWTWTARGRIPF